jgi:hypothetical protein
MAHEHHDHDHQGHDHSHDEGTFGLAIGIRIVEEAGKMYMAEAEISPYVDEPSELGVTLVFHPLDGVNPTADADDLDWPAWPLDIDDDLARNGTDPIPVQFQSIVRQLHGLSEGQLVEYLRAAREEAE